MVEKGDALATKHFFLFLFFPWRILIFVVFLFKRERRGGEELSNDEQRECAD